MNGRSLDPIIESSLGKARFQFKWLRFWRLLGIVAFAELAAVLLLGVLMWQGLFVHRTGVLLVVAFLLCVAILALPVTLIASLAIYRDRSWAAEQVERADESLLDRVNTLVHLEETGEENVFAPRIERQATSNLLWDLTFFNDERRSVRLLWLLSFLLLFGTFFFFVELTPTMNLVSGRTAEAQPVDGLVLPDEPIVDAAELQAERVEERWGEVRITEPARDLRVTKVDVVPLQIEAAASHPIDKAYWVTTTTGAVSVERPLPPPEEPRYAVYQPYLYVDELRLSDWDVMSYHAGAKAEDGSYTSEIYFLEVRPFREEIEKMKGDGGENGGGSPGYQMMGQISGLINRQKDVLRETHRFLGRLASNANVREQLLRQDQEKLVDAESAIDEAVHHLYARMAAEMENMPIGEVLERLALAGDELADAVAALREDPSTAPTPEQNALAELVATRKVLQRVLNENASQSDEPQENPLDQLPVAELEDKLEQMAEYRDELVAAYRLKKMLDEEARQMNEMAAEPGETSQESASRTAEAARETTRQLKELMENSETGEKFGPELGEALSDRQQAQREEELDRLGDAEGEKERGQAAKQAAEGLEKLSDAFEASVPEAMRDAEKNDPLKSDPADSLAAAMRQLEALTGAQGANGTTTARQRELRDEALENLRDSLPHFMQEDSEDDVAALLAEAEEALAEEPEEREYDMERLRELLARLERFRHEMVGIDFERPDVDLAHIDPSKLPAEYRERIQNYFRELSER